MSNSNNISNDFIPNPFYIEELYVEPSKNIIIENNNTRSIQPKVMEVLVYLCSKAKEVVSPEELITNLVRNCTIPVISAGGVGCKHDIDNMLGFGAAGVSVGSPFIASTEAGVTQEYKQACVDFGADDIVMTERISGTPCTVINTPYVKKIGTKQTWIEHVLNKNKKLKKWVKMIRFSIGMNAATKAATKVTYKTVWVAGPSIEHTKSILPTKAIIDNLVN
mgnify:CR=1 FL=1